LGLKGYILRRAIDSLITLFLIFLVNFFVFFTRMEQYSGMTQTEQFVAYLKFVFIDQFGRVDIAGSPRTIDYVLSVMPPTLNLLVSSILLVILFSLIFGAVASYKFGKSYDLLITMILIFICMVPAWWLGLSMNRVVPNLLGVDARNPQYFFIKQSILPPLTLLLCLCGIFFLIVRNSMVNIFPQKFVMLAKAKGVNARSLIFKHVMRNALLAITAMLALAPFLIINQLPPIERVFQINGVGKLLFDSLISPLGVERIPLTTVQVIFLTLATLTIVSHFILDIVQHWLDPRLKYPTMATDGGFPKRFRRKVFVRKKKFGLFWRKFTKTKSGLIGLAMLALFLIVAILAPVLPITDPEKAFSPHRPQPPEPFISTILSDYFISGGTKVCLLKRIPPLPKHWLGTDEIGRDVLSRNVWGARVSLFEGIATTLLAILVGCFVGLIAGYFEGQWFSYLLDRISEVFLSMPILVFIIFFPLEIGEVYYDIRAVFRWVLAVGFSTWAITAKLVRSQVILAKERANVEAARAMGANDRHIIWHYILPEAIPVMVSSIVYVATIVLAMQSTLDLFGFRRYFWSKNLETLPPLKNAPYISWGTLLSYSTFNASLSMNWWMLIPPATCIALLGLAMVLVSNKVADTLNPEL